MGKPRDTGFAVGKGTWEALRWLCLDPKQRRPGSKWVMEAMRKMVQAVASQDIVYYKQPCQKG